MADKMTKIQLRKIIREELARPVHKINSNKSALQYRAYKALLEVDITDEQRLKLMEAGIFQKIADFFGAGKDTLTTDLKKIFKSNKFNRRAATAKKNIEKEIDELKAIAKEAGVSDEAVYDMLNLTLQGKDVSPADVASPPKVDAEPDDESKETETEKSSAPIDSSKPKQAVPSLAAAAAEASGEDPKKGKEQAKEAGVDVPKATKVLAAAIAKQSNSKPEFAGKVIDWLIQNKHLVAESGNKITAYDLTKATKIFNDKHGSKKIIVERWQKLAGLDYINELNSGSSDEPNAGDESGKSASDGKNAAMVKNKFGDLLGDVQKGLGIKDEDEEAADSLINILIALDDLDSIKITK